VLQQALTRSDLVEPRDHGIPHSQQARILNEMQDVVQRRILWA
jgi:hypothetical protein